MAWICQIIISCGDIGMAVIVIVGGLGLFALFSFICKLVLGENGKGD
jgi:hypothetical protein